MPVTRRAVSGTCWQAHAGVDGEVVDALLGLLDQRVLEDLPVELERVAVDLLQRLVDRHRADRHRRVADDPAADVVDVAPGREVHDRVGAPADRPHHLLDLLGRRRHHGRVADVGVDLDEEVAADRHRLDFRVVDVGRDDGAPAGDLVAHELRRDEGRDRGAEALAVGELRLAPRASAASRARFSRWATKTISSVTMPARANSYCVTIWPARAAAHGALGRAGSDELLDRDVAVVLRLHRTRRDRRIAARRNPRLAHQRRPGGEVDHGIGLGIGPGRVVDAHRRLERVGERDLAQGDADVGPAGRRGVDLARALDRAGGDALRQAFEVRDGGVHQGSPRSRRRSGVGCGGFKPQKVPVPPPE